MAGASNKSSLVILFCVQSTACQQKMHFERSTFADVLLL